MSDDHLKPIDTIRLSPRDRQRLIDEIQRPSRGMATPKQERRRLRVEYNGHVVVSLRNPDGTTVRYSVTPRNLSTHGLGFIHGQYVHADRPCQVIIPTLTGEWVLTQARISRCLHLTKLIHDVSVVFETPITLDHYVVLTPQQALTHSQQSKEKAAPNATAPIREQPRLTGSVLVADSVANDRQLYAMWLGKLGLKPFQAAHEQEIHKALGHESIQLLLIDMALGDMTGLQTVRQLRMASFAGPIIVTTDQETDELQAQALKAGANAIITKPLDRQSLHQIVEQLLLLAGDDETRHSKLKLRSQLTDDPDMRPFIRSFVTELKSLTEMITQARAAQDKSRLQTLCNRIKAGGASYGFAPLTRMAKLTLGQMQNHPNIPAAENALDELLAMLGRVSVE